jgi:glycosyltransferase involved in cell wall biosynthesis
MTSTTAEHGAGARQATEQHLRIVYVLPRFPNLSETFVLNELRELTRIRQEVTVVSRERPEPGEPLHPDADGFARLTVYCPSGVLRRLRVGLACMDAFVACPRRTCRTLALCVRLALRTPRSGAIRAFGEACAVRREVPKNIDVVHAHFAYAAPTGAALARLLGCSFSFTGHAVDIFISVPPRILQALLAEARLALATSAIGRDRMLEVASPSDRAKVVLVRNGIDRTQFRARPSEPGGVPLVLSVGRLVEKKGIDTLIEALAVLLRRDIDFRCEIVGDGPLRAQLEALTQLRGLTERARFLGGLDRLSVMKVFDRAAVFVLPCRRTASGDQDGVPNVLLEAMVIGIPIVAGAAGGVAEVVKSERSGLLVAPDAPAALADAIERVLDDPALRHRLVQGGFAEIRNSSLNASAGELRDLFTSIALDPTIHSSGAAARTG